MSPKWTRHTLNHWKLKNIDNQGEKSADFLRYSSLNLFEQVKMVRYACKCLFKLCKVFSLFMVYQIEYI